MDHAFRLGTALSLATLCCVVAGLIWFSRSPLKTEH